MTVLCESQIKSFGGLQGVYTHESEVLGCNMTFSVYLPLLAQTEKLPVLYYLSGLTCTQENVTTKGGFQQYADEQGVIIVCPDTSPRGTNYPGEHDDYDFGSGAGFYVNATQEPWSQSYLMYDYIVEELPKTIASKFPVVQERAGIFGHSMGGHGAMVIGLRNPDKFQSISAFAPICAPIHCPWGRKAFSYYLGDNIDDWKSYDATELIKSGHYSKFEILVDQGSADQFLENQLLPKPFIKACQEAGQPLEFRLQQGYDHSYYLMNTFMQDHIRFHAERLAKV